MPLLLYQLNSVNWGFHYMNLFHQFVLLEVVSWAGCPFLILLPLKRLVHETYIERWIVDGGCTCVWGGGGGEGAWLSRLGWGRDVSLYKTYRQWELTYCVTNSWTKFRFYEGRVFGVAKANINRGMFISLVCVYLYVKERRFIREWSATCAPSRIYTVDAGIAKRTLFQLLAR